MNFKSLKTKVAIIQKPVHQICSANQLTGFYMMRISTFYGLMLKAVNYSDKGRNGYLK